MNIFKSIKDIFSKKLAKDNDFAWTFKIEINEELLNFIKSNGYIKQQD